MTTPGSPRPAYRLVQAGDGLELFCETSGRGPALVLLHGFTGSTASWEPVRRQLAAEITVVAVDLPGHGRSSAPSDAGRYALARFADDLALVLDALDLPDAAMLGYSLGARAALAFATAHPARVRRLVLVSGSPGLDDETQRVERIRSDAALADRIERDGLEAFVRYWEALPLWQSQRALDDVARRALRGQRMRNAPHGLANSLRGAGMGAAPSLMPVLGRITAPSLLMAGALDPGYLGIARRMAAAIPRATVSVVPDAGHAIALERPAELASRVLDFLRGG